MVNNYGGYQCLACGSWHPGSGNLPCPKQVPMAKAGSDIRNLSISDLLWVAAWAAGIEDGLLFGAADNRGGANWDVDELGILVHEKHPSVPMPTGKSCISRMRQGGYGWLWNPLNDAGDLYRLASKLKISIDFKCSRAYHLTESGALIEEYFEEVDGGDRLAVVRVAVRMHKSLRQYG